MRLSVEDSQLLQELCNKNNVNFNKVLKLLDAVREYEFKERRSGIQSKLKNIMQNHDNEGEM